MAVPVRDGYGLSNNRHINQAGAVITYDLAGHRASDQNGARTFTLDDSGRLSQIHQGTALVATYSYNAFEDIHDSVG